MRKLPCCLPYLIQQPLVALNQKIYEMKNACPDSNILEMVYEELAKTNIVFENLQKRLVFASYLVKH